MEFGTIFWVFVILAIPVAIIYSCIKTGIDASNNPDKYIIDGIFDTNNQRYYRHTLLVCFAIRYKDGHTVYEWVEAASRDYG